MDEENEMTQLDRIEHNQKMIKNRLKKTHGNTLFFVVLFVLSVAASFFLYDTYSG